MHHKTVLDNGVRIVTEKVAHCRTAAVGIWVDVGSRDEHNLNNGCAHFVEHMFFKGTAKRSAQQIARELDILGGTANAYTTRENTCFYATVLDSHIPQLVELFGDLFLNSLFSEEEVERERQVILQEFAMVEDTPDEQLHDLFVADLWGGHPLGYPVLGSREVVAAMDSAKLHHYVEQAYTPDKIIIAAAGNIDHDRFVDLWRAYFSDAKAGVDSSLARRVPPEQQVCRKVYVKPLEQLHLVLGTYGLPLTSPDRYALYLLNVLLGGNMSSRLFQEIREKRGLAYSIASDVSGYSDSGYLAVSLGIEPRSANQVLELVGREVRRFGEEVVGDEELANAMEYIRAGLYLSADNMDARMTRLARNEFCFGRFVSLDEVAKSFAQVSAKEILELGNRLFSRQLAGAVIGSVEENQIDWQRLDR
ncbi:MAG: insulinase family protein [Desulfobulbaceae bacterium]|nr:insulinase family protein [Desulfobulbaceae bacterium]